MKKFITGVVVGALLFGAVPVFADSIKSLIGTKVTGVYSVEQGGKKIAEGAVINGSAYVPVRAIADAVGVPLKVEGKVITLDEIDASTTSPGVTSPPEGNALSDEALAWTNQIQKLRGDIGTYKGNITAENVNKKNLEDAVATEKARTEKVPGILESLETNLAKSRATIADYETKITTAEAEITRLQSLIDANK